MAHNKRHLVGMAMTPGGLAALNAVVGDQSKLDADAAALAAAEAAQATDTAQQTTDQAALATFVASKGPIFSLDSTGTLATVVLPSPNPPGYSIVSANQAT